MTEENTSAPFPLGKQQTPKLAFSQVNSLNFFLSFILIYMLCFISARNTPTASRFHNSSRKQEEFAVQDTNDFNERVINEKGKLTIVDFHAR